MYIDENSYSYVEGHRECFSGCFGPVSTKGDGKSDQAEVKESSDLQKGVTENVRLQLGSLSCSEQKSTNVEAEPKMTPSRSERESTTIASLNVHTVLDAKVPPQLPRDDAVRKPESEKNSQAGFWVESTKSVGQVMQAKPDVNAENQTKTCLPKPEPQVENPCIVGTSTAGRIRNAAELKIKEKIPALMESPESPTKEDVLDNKPPVIIPWDRRDSLQESRERLKKFMTQSTPSAPRSEQDSFSKPSFKVHQTRVTTPETSTLLRDNPPGAVTCSQATSVPHIGTSELRSDTVAPTGRSQATPIPNVGSVGSKIDSDSESELPFLKKYETFLPTNTVSQPDNSDHAPVLSLREKLGQEIDVVHKVGVSTGGALRSLIRKEERKSFEKSSEDGDRGKLTDVRPPDNEKVSKDPRRDLRRNSVEGHHTQGNAPARADPRLIRSSNVLTEAAPDDGSKQMQANSFQQRNIPTACSMDSLNQLQNLLSVATDGVKKSVRPTLLNDAPRPTGCALPDPIIASSPLVPDPKPNILQNEPYPHTDLSQRPQGPLANESWMDLPFYRQSQPAQGPSNFPRSHVVCPTLPFSQRTRFPAQNRALLPTPIRLTSPWGSPPVSKQTTAHQLGIRYQHRPNTGARIINDDHRTEVNTPRQGTCVNQQFERQTEVSDLVGKDDTVSRLGIDTQSRPRPNKPPIRLSEKDPEITVVENIPNISTRKVDNKPGSNSSEFKARSGRETSQESPRFSDRARSGRESSRDSPRFSDRKKREERSERRTDHRKDKDRHYSRRSNEMLNKTEKSGDFSSPLNSLYRNVPQPSTGKGYGIQSFKIPKKKSAPPPPEQEKAADSSPTTKSTIAPLTQPPSCSTTDLKPLTTDRKVGTISPPRDPRTMRAKSRPPSPITDKTPDVPDTTPVRISVATVSSGTASLVPGFEEIKLESNRGTSPEQIFVYSDKPITTTKQQTIAEVSSNVESTALAEETAPRLTKESTPDGSGRSQDKCSSEGRETRARSTPRSPIPGDRRSRARSQVRSPSPVGRKSRDRSRAKSPSPEYRRSRAHSRKRSRSPECRTSRARSRMRSKSPEDRMSRARSRMRSGSPVDRLSRARSRMRSKSPESRMSRARSRIRSKSPEDRKSRARSRMRSRSPEDRKSRARSRMRSRSPEDRKSRGRSRIGSRSPDERRFRGRSRMKSRSPERRKSRARSPTTSPLDSRPSSNFRAKSTHRSPSPDVPPYRSKSCARSKTPERSSRRSTSRDSHQTNDSSSYSRSSSRCRRRSRSRYRESSNERSRLRDKPYQSRKRSKSRDPSRERSQDRYMSRESGRYYSSPSRSDKRGRRRTSRSVSPYRNRLSRSKRTPPSERRSPDRGRSRARRRSRSRSPSREITIIHKEDSPGPVTDLHSVPSGTSPAKVEPDVSSTSCLENGDPALSSTSDIQPMEVKEDIASDPDAKKAVSSDQPTEKSKPESSSSVPTFVNPLALLFNSGAVEDGGLREWLETLQSITKAVPIDKLHKIKKMLEADEKSTEAGSSSQTETNSTPSVETETTATPAEEASTSTASGDVKEPKPPPKRRNARWARKTKSGGAAAATATAPPATAPPATAGSSSATTEEAPQDSETVEKHPRRKVKTELDKLQEDIREMFISAEVVSATGQRTCRARREAQDISAAKARTSSNEKTGDNVPAVTSSKELGEVSVDGADKWKQRERHAASKINISSDSDRTNRSEEAEHSDDDNDHATYDNAASESDDDIPLTELQIGRDLRTPPVTSCTSSESSPVRLPGFKKRKYNLIESETESEFDAIADGKVPPCSVVIDKLSAFDEGTVQPLPSRNTARRGKKRGFANFGNRKVQPEEPKVPIKKEAVGEVEDFDKSLIDCSNIIICPKAEEHGKLTRRQLKMLMIEQGSESSSAQNSGNDGPSSIADVQVEDSIQDQSTLGRKSASRTGKPVRLQTQTPKATMSSGHEDTLQVSETISSSGLTDWDSSKSDDPPVLTPEVTDSSVDHVASPQKEPPPLKGVQVNDAKSHTDHFPWVYSTSFVKCRYCAWKGKAVVRHYITQHPKEEVDYARFPAPLADKLFQVAEKEHYDTMTLDDLSSRYPRTTKRGGNFLQCILCRTMVTPQTFSKHFSSHTGEYHFECNICGHSDPSKEAVSEHSAAVHPGKRPLVLQIVHTKVPPVNVVLAHVCSVCNYFQLQKKSVEEHIQRAHPHETACRTVCVAVSEHVIMNPSTPVKTPQAGSKSKPTEEVKSPETPTEPAGESDGPSNVSQEIVPSSDAVPTAGQDTTQTPPTTSQQSEPPAAAEREERSKEGTTQPPVSTSETSETFEKKSIDDISTSASVDLSVFISSDPVQSQDQQIEEERLKTLRVAEETLRNRFMKPRLSILDRLAERFKTPEESSPPQGTQGAEETSLSSLLSSSPVSEAGSLPSLRATPARRANKSLLNMGWTVAHKDERDVSAERKITRQQGAKTQTVAETDSTSLVLPGSLEAAEPGKTFMSAGELSSTLERMRKKLETPVIARSRSTSNSPFRTASATDDSIFLSTVFKMRNPNVTSVRVGDVEVRCGSDEGMFYVCHGDRCLFTSSLPSLYLDHLSSEHPRWRARLVCSACDSELDEPGDMLSAFQHIRTLHLTQEFPPVQPPQTVRRSAPTVPLVRARRMPGDKLSEPSSSPLKSFANLFPQTGNKSSQGENKPQEEEDSAPFCRIENVVSLSSVSQNDEENTIIDVESADPLPSSSEPEGCPPVPPAAPLSPRQLAVQPIDIWEKAADPKQVSPEGETSDDVSALRKKVVEPSETDSLRLGISQHGKCVSFMKESAAASRMLTKDKLRHFFKCTGRRCSYTTNIKANFVYHYNMHVAKESENSVSGSKDKFEWSKCVYCGNEETSGIRLTDHMVQFHGGCRFQCTYCLYRAAYQANIVFHQNLSHTSNPVCVLECRTVAELPPKPELSPILELYRCVQGLNPCTEEFFFTEDFKKHLQSKHIGNAFKCAICLALVMSAELLVLHYSVVHALRAYHCLYCRKSAETKEEMKFHLCYDHPEETVIVAARIRSENEQGVSDANIKLPHIDKNINLVRLEEECANEPALVLTLPPLAAGSLYLPSEETDDFKQDVVFDNIRHPKEKSPLSRDKSDSSRDKNDASSRKEIIILSDDDPTTDVELSDHKEKSSHVEKEAISSRETTLPDLTSSKSQSERPVEPLTTEPKKLESAPSIEETMSKIMKEIGSTGLSGAALYRCGHTNCSYSAENMAQLTDHIHTCDFSRLSPTLTCVHCYRTYKVVSSFLDHLRTHGVHRYSCGICDFRAAIAGNVLRHLKVVHRSFNCTVVPLHPLHKDPDTSLFCIQSKDTHVGKRGRVPKHQFVSLQKTLYSPGEINMLPPSAVFTRELRCALCNYSNKVRCNLVRHLQQHASGREASPTPVVNPVPHLERHEKMFDSMTNHAVSSNLAQRRDSSNSAKDLEDVPRFVPEQGRYACSSGGCAYISSDESRLLLHLRTLHSEELVYNCPHCRDSMPEGLNASIPLDRLGHHLKMHDSRLYKCCHCPFYHHHRHVVLRHTTDKHAEQGPFIKVVREPEQDSSSHSQALSDGSSEQSGQEGTDSEGVTATKEPPLYQCGLCAWQSTRAEVVNHARNAHRVSSLFQCGGCDYRVNQRRKFNGHFERRHDGVPQDVISILSKVDRSSSNSKNSNQETTPSDTSFVSTPLWLMPRVKHVRGIFFEENGTKPKELEHGDFDDSNSRNGKRSSGYDHKDGPESKRMTLGGPSTKIQKGDTTPLTTGRYRCPKCSQVFDVPEPEFRVHLFEEAESSSWLCGTCSKKLENFSSLVSHYVVEHGVLDTQQVIKTALYDTRVSDWVNSVIAKQQSQASSSSSDASTSRKTRMSIRSVASSPVSCPPSGGASPSTENSTEFAQPPRKGRPLPVHPSNRPEMKAPSPSPLKLQPGTVAKVLVVKPMTLSAAAQSTETILTLVPSRRGKADLLQPSSSGDTTDLLESSIEEVEEDDKSNEEWTPFEKPHDNKCRVCGAVFTSHQDLRIHVENEHGGASEAESNPAESATAAGQSGQRRFRCSHCEFAARTTSEIRLHEKRHWLFKPLKCGHCGSQFVRENDVRKHSKTAHPKLPVEVVENPVPAEQSYIPLQKKRKAMLPSPTKKTEAPTCPDTPDSKTSEASTSSMSHSEQNLDNVFWPTVYRCRYCPRRDTSVHQLKIHWESNHCARNAPNVIADHPFKYEKIEESEVLYGKRPYKFRCGECQKTGSVPDLAEHYKLSHPGSPIALNGCLERVLQCFLCICQFQNVNTLSRHYIQRHPGYSTPLYDKKDIAPDTGRKQYQCLWCQEMIHSLRGLAVHHDRFHCHLQPKYKEIDKETEETPPEPERKDGALASTTPSPADKNCERSGESCLRSYEPNPIVRAVARKSTSRVRSVARKSTAKPSRACASNVQYYDVDVTTSDSDDGGPEEGKSQESRSFYGCPSSPVDVKRITCPVQFGPIVRRVNVATAAQEMDLHPVVKVYSDYDYSNSQPFNDSPSNSEPFGNSDNSVL